MGKKSKKRKRKKSSSSSSDEEEKRSWKRESAKSAERKHDSRSHERHATKRDRPPDPPAVKEVSHSSRQIKTAVYRLQKPGAADQRPANREEGRAKTSRDSEPPQRETCSSKTKQDVSGKHRPVSGSRSPGKGTSRDPRSSETSPPRAKQQLTSPARVPAQQKDQNAAKWCHEAGEPARAEKVKNIPKVSFVFKDSLEQRRWAVVRKMRKLHQEKLKSSRSSGPEVKTPPAAASKASSPPAEQTTSISRAEAAQSVAPPSPPPAQTSSVATPPPPPPPPLRFKIPKKAERSPENNDASDTNLKHEPKVSTSEAEPVLEATPTCSPAAPAHPPPPADPVAEPWKAEMQVVEELHLARSDRRLEVDVMQSYGELTCMDIDPPEEGAADAQFKPPPQQDLILVLDTNVLLSHLDYVKRMRTHGLGGLGFPVVLIPWVVLQELDSLKRGKGLSGSVAHLAIPAISYIYNSLKSREPNLWGQSMQQAAESRNGLNAENNDDRVLQCCLQYQSLHPECALILCTNDKNLCSKALLSGVEALSKDDLQAEASGRCPGTKACERPHAQVTPAERSTCVSVGRAQKGNNQPRKTQKEHQTKWDVSVLVCELADCLRDVLSDVLEVEMKAAYDDLWLEIVYLKPPWTLQDVLHCLKKHWIAVFGHVVPRRKLESVLNLINFFNSGDRADRSSTSAALGEAKDLVRAFEKRSSRAGAAFSAMADISTQLQPQGEPPACDVIMNDDDDEVKPSSSPRVSHQEVWILFENIWSSVFQASLEVFKALDFDPQQSAQPPAGRRPPPQEALLCLHKLSSTVSQLLQAFSSILSPAASSTVQTLLSIINANKITAVDSRLTAEDLLDCFSQQEYREKLSVGGNQLMELKEALDRCQQLVFSSS